ncbi:Adenine nucleotide alpha hydrolases-like superfamily protein [Striga hermonthica]|uniref:Adenine nucleotide alpha hydrolases-like superfamily protein n=1 Tax=Striga hermonthica TaxID=68872 RepID=A0A9N7RPN3_STRHE|nr:Adenine nucleotide alpha hydrolases-like superfamily protein [Striga hermonthica]
MSSLDSSSSLMRQLSRKQGWKSRSKRWGVKQMEGGGGYSLYGGGVVVVKKKRVMVVVEQSTESKHAMMWALTHVTNKGDILTLLHILPPNAAAAAHPSSSSCASPHLATTLASLCKASKPERCCSCHFEVE